LLCCYADCLKCGEWLPVCASLRECSEAALQRLYAGEKSADMHICMAAGIDRCNQAGLGPGHGLKPERIQTEPLQFCMKGVSAGDGFCKGFHQRLVKN
jgi:hypothetical protein